jgi:hypothetical protein
VPADQTLPNTSTKYLEPEPSKPATTPSTSPISTDSTEWSAPIRPLKSPSSASSSDASSQIEKELALIAQLEVAPYFLSVHSIVGINHIQIETRGSAANSAVYYCLGDFEHDRREEVLQTIYSRYGRDRAVDALSSLVSWWDSPGVVDPVRLRQAGFDPDDPLLKHVFAMTTAEGWPGSI